MCNMLGGWVWLVGGVVGCVICWVGVVGVVSVCYMLMGGWMYNMLAGAKSV